MKVVAKFELPKEIVEADPTLLAQAVRVHLANQRQGTQSALTRADVSRTRKKYQKQKGSGNARHGDRKAPIFVGGGIAFAPKPRDHSLSMPTKMKAQAIGGAIFAKNKSGDLVVVSDMANLSGKTAEVADFLAENATTSKKLLIVTDEQRENVYRAGRNIPGVLVLPFSQVNTYEILKADKVIIMEEALKMERVQKVEKNEKVNKEVKKEAKAPKVEKKEVKKSVVKKTAVKKTVTKKTK